MSKTVTKAWEPADHLENEEDMAAYLAAAPRGACARQQRAVNGGASSR